MESVVKNRPDSQTRNIPTVFTGTTGVCSWTSARRYQKGSLQFGPADRRRKPLTKLVLLGLIILGLVGLPAIAVGSGWNMATELMLPNGDSANNWDVGTFADVNQGVDTPNDTLLMSDASLEGAVVIFDMDDTAITDADTVTNVTIRTRAHRGTNANDSLGVDLLIGGITQGSQVARALGTGFDDVDSNDSGWNVDWTASQLDSLTARLTTLQTAMPSVVDITLSELEVVITFTPAAAPAPFLPFFNRKTNILLRM